MPRPVFPMLVLLLAFAAGPVLAQSAPMTEADASTAARTMEQSRRVYTDRPAERPAANAPAPAQGNGKPPPLAVSGGQPAGALSGGKPVAQR